MGRRIVFPFLFIKRVCQEWRDTLAIKNEQLLFNNFAGE